jgi:hypothetical protein
MWWGQDSFIRGAQQTLMGIYIITSTEYISVLVTQHAATRALKFQSGMEWQSFASSTCTSTPISINISLIHPFAIRHSPFAIHSSASSLYAFASRPSLPLILLALFGTPNHAAHISWPSLSLATLSKQPPSPFHNRLSPCILYRG